MDTQSYSGYCQALFAGIADYPEDVWVDESQDERGILLTVSVNPRDMGKVIGIEGRNIKAVRTLILAFGAKHDARVAVKLIEPDGRDKHPGKQDKGAQDSEA